LRERGFNTQALKGSTGAHVEAPFVTLARQGGQLLATSDGPRLATLELDGWDTHSAQTFRLDQSLQLLDAGIAALKDGLGPVWADTIVLIMTEFGRTVRMNGTLGTDHGTATAALALGGPVAGGRVQADWPGLAEPRLFENRDLQPTLDIRSVAKGLLGPHYGFSHDVLNTIFPDSPAIEQVPGLLRA
jgi:uncharacterized protein (DUF1501 family)